VSGRVDKLRQLFARAAHLKEEGELDASQAAYEELLAVEPRHAPAWFNLSLIHKQRRRWPELLRCCRRVLELDPNDEGAKWNLGIAATALRDWSTAREAWRRYGLAMPDGDGPLELDYGQTPIRLNPEGDAEIVWGRRIDPARVVIENVPLPESGHRWHDVVLHDGEPRGERTIGERSYHVFDELERWQPSGTPTLSVALEAPDASAAEELVVLARSRGWDAEDWSGHVRMLCQECSESHVPGEGTDDETWTTHRHFGIAAPPDQAERLLAEWAASGDARRHGPVEVVL
jgi:hypothetical protein